jgi:GTP-binding protein
MKPLRAELVVTAAKAEDFPREGLVEIAFLGRSNVGKSSLLNRLVARRGLARTSSTPGKTRLINFYRVDLRLDPVAGVEGVAPHERSVLLVDLPGYGWAQVSKQERAGWQRLVEGYLAGRRELRAAVLLQDLRRDVSDDEQLLLAWLEERRIPALVALTKSDKLAPMQRARRVRELGPTLALPRDRVITTSAETSVGIAELWKAIEPHL